MVISMTMSEEIIKILDELCKRFGLAIDWTNENVIPYITVLFDKLVNYEIVASIVYIIFSIFLIVGSIIGIKKFAPVFKKGLEENRHSYNDGWEISTPFVVIALVVINAWALVDIGCEIMDIIECVVFPEMYVFEYIQSFIQ